MSGLFIDGVPRPDHGPGMVQIVCADCHAGWVGRRGDGCAWCDAGDARRRAAERALLLDPPWLRSDAGDPRYDELSDIDQRVWDATRGQRRGADSLAAWRDRLARAVVAGLITETEARRAWGRVAA